ncbi:hypothetical protein SAY87_024151 [Trapa incisa]|uniref:Tify domain-containing protein n=1 Tax=Trapa incisa TaxID=236973 RepID=A0AAN7L033_9MYRT|nr:hypothetical protein SAY87_024151 [Trapa incisa]
MNVSGKDQEDLLLKDSLFELSMSRVPQDPRIGFYYSGARKVKATQVIWGEHIIPGSIVQGYNKTESHHLFVPRGDGIITLGITNGQDGSGISTGKLHGIEDESASIGQTYGEDKDNVSISQMMGKEQHSILSSGEGYQKDSCTIHLYKQEVINAYEFERHADCKTKHPNNHIYFENRKTIHVQELRSTPQRMLFEAMQIIPINQKSFRLWKESYLAATRELQHI